MTEDDFRRLAISLPGVTEGAHMNHPDFRIGRRIFATMGSPGPGWAMVKLAPEQQRLLIDAEPTIFSGAKGAWGRQGSTIFRLENADAATAESALRMAWGNFQAR